MIKAPRTSWASASSLALLAATAIAACSPSDTKTPGIDLGAPEIRWADKSKEQKMGFMAARVQPVMHEHFAKYDASFKGNGAFTCETCHGQSPELVDWAMPSPDLYALPAEDPIGVTMSDDAEVGNFMMGVVTPALQKLYDQGHGTSKKANCFSCHPVE